MRKIGVCAVLAAIGMMAAAGDAFAVTTVDCSTLSALLTAFASGGAENTTYSIINGPCTGGITITQDNITIKASSGTQTIQGGAAAGGASVSIMGASNIILQDLTIDATTSMTNGSFAVHIFGPASG